MKIYLNETPRSIALLSNGHALIFRHPDQKDENTSPRCIVEFVPENLFKIENYRDITRSNCYGFLGLLSVKQNIYLGLITNKINVANPNPNANIEKITGVEFYCLNNDEWDYLIDRPSNNNEEDKHTSEYPCSSVRKLLSAGSFYYSREFDITSNLQERGIKDSNFKLSADGEYFKRFNWNNFMNSELIQFRSRLSSSEKKIFDEGCFLTTITRGFAHTVNTSVGAFEGTLTIISKQSCLKNGPLFGCWGVDDDGNVSNFVESEVILYTDKYCFSYVTVRGNVPVFWELDSQLLSSKIEFPRSFEATQHAFQRHFDILNQQFGDIQILNSLTHKGVKKELSEQYKDHFTQASKVNPQVAYANLELSSNSTRYWTSRVLDKLGESLLNFGALFYDVKKGHYIGKQLGTFRINCLDCVNKSNTLQKIITQEVIELALRDFGITSIDELLAKHAQLWNENGKFLAKVTLNSISSKNIKKSKSSIAGAMAKKYLGGVVDTRAKQQAIDKLLGRLQDQVSVSLHDPIHDFVTAELSKRSKEFSSTKDISIFAGTFNVNGVTYTEDINSWIFPPEVDTAADVVIIGFQEIVELTAGQMLNTDSSNRQFWEKKIKQCLEEKDRYVSLWSGQLGGIVLLLFIKESEIENIKNVEGSFKKTGLGGMSANKGGVSVSFSFSNTNFCFVVSHLAAGLNNTDERHNDYKTLAKGIRFSRNRRIKDHDAVIWVGDFNYRISLSNEVVRDAIEEAQFTKLFEFDQLNNQMSAGESFPYFDEMEIKFPPTYKFDNGTTTYDTSEKQRIPAWTDRVLSLSRNKILKQLTYNCSDDIIFSDHRPVYATFNASVSIVDEVRKSELAHDLYELRKSEVGDVNDLINAAYLNEITLTHGFPPPSSDKRKWWIDGGQAAKVMISELGPDMLINPGYPINPFETTDSPEFISKKEFLGTAQFVQKKEVVT